MEELEKIERYIILLLGSLERPMPSIWHLQKELFILSKIIPKIEVLFNFERHYNGPYSSTIQETVDSPFHFENSFEYDAQRRIHLTSLGLDYYDKIVSESQNKKNFDALLQVVKLIRIMYDKLSKDELLFLVYKTYPDYTDLSNIYEEWSSQKKKELADSLKKKELITPERHKELLNVE